MTPQLSPELRQALAQLPDRPLQIEHPFTRVKYILVGDDYDADAIAEQS